MPQIIIEDDDPEKYSHHRHGSHHRSRRHHHHRHHSRWRRACLCFDFRIRLRSSGRYRIALGITFLFLVAAFVLYLLVAISVPVIKSIYLFQLSYNQPDTTPDFRFGVWGLCTSRPIPLPTILTDHDQCTSPRIGYDIPQDVLDMSGYPPEVTNAVVKTLTVLLVLHPVSAGLSLLALLFALFFRSQYFIIMSLITAIVTAIVGSVVLAADLALAIVANNRLRDSFDGAFAVTMGNGQWMMVAAVAMSWCGVIALSAIACRCCGIRRKHGWYGDGFHG